MKLSFNQLILLFPCFCFFYWIDNADRNSKFFPIIYYFYWIYFSLFALFSLDLTIFSFLFFPLVLKHVSDMSSWGVWLLLIVLSLGSDWLDYIFFKKMFRLRRELGKSKAGRHWFILFENQIRKAFVFKGTPTISSQENVNKKVESGMTFPDFFDRMKIKKALTKRGVDDGTFV